MLERKPDSPFPGLVDRFVTYARIHTTSAEDSDTYPSTLRQFDLARLLVDELKDLGLANAAVDEHCYVTASVPASPGCEKVPAIAFISHMDTYPEVSGENVVPTFHENYQGADIELPNNDKRIVAAENPYLQECLGETIITADGTTLLGADDKAGIAEIMEALTRINENPDWEHGPPSSTSTWRSSAPPSPTPWTAAAAVRSRTRPSAPTAPSSLSWAGTSTPGTRRTR